MSDNIDSEKKVLIAGAGIAGLSLARHLKMPCRIYEKEDSIGGICGSFTLAGCTFDYAPRVLLPGDAYATKMSETLLGDNLHFIPFRDWIYHHGGGAYSRVPIQNHLFGLSPERILEYLKGMVEAYRQNDDRIPNNYRDWLIRRLGRPLADQVIILQESKKWKTPTEDMAFEWAQDRVIRPDLETALFGATHDTPQETLLGYPLKGGIDALSVAMARSLPRVRTGMAIRSIDLKEKKVRFEDGSTDKYQAMVSTFPLPILTELIEDFPEDLRKKAAKLRHLSLHCIFFVIGKPFITDKQFIYVYDESLIFHRLSFPANLTPFAVPPGYSSLIAEVSFHEPDRIPSAQLIQRVRKDLIAMNILEKSDEVVEAEVRTLIYAYPLPESGTKAVREEIGEYLATKDMFLFGRFGEWKYLNINHIFPDSRELANLLERRYGKNSSRA